MMKKLLIPILAVLTLLGGVPDLGVSLFDGRSAHAAGCLNPGQQRQAIARGQARPFGAIASRLRGELINARLCRQGGRLVYIVTFLSGNRRVDAVFDARTGRRLR